MTDIVSYSDLSHPVLTRGTALQDKERSTQETISGLQVLLTAEAGLVRQLWCKWQLCQYMSMVKNGEMRNVYQLEPFTEAKQRIHSASYCNRISIFYQAHQGKSQKPSHCLFKTKKAFHKSIPPLRRASKPKPATPRRGRSPVVPSR